MRGDDIMIVFVFIEIGGSLGELIIKGRVGFWFEMIVFTVELLLTWKIAIGWIMLLFFSMELIFESERSEGLLVGFVPEYKLVLIILSLCLCVFFL